MQTNAEQNRPLERTINLAVPKDKFEAEVESRLKRLTRTVKMQGFRPGKVPFKMVAQQYGGQVRQEVLGDQVQQSFNDAVREQNLRVAGYPRIEPRAGADDVAQIEFSAVFEVYPEVVVGDLAAASIERPAVDLGDADIDKTLEVLRKQRVGYETVERAAADGDQVEIDYRGTLDGEPFAGGQGKGVALALGQGRLLKDFETRLAGMKAGDAKGFDLTFPADYHAREMAGKTVRFDVDMKRVGAAKLPEINEDFARALGVQDGSVASMRQEILENLQREVKSRVHNKLKEQVLDALLQVTPVDLPAALVEMEIGRMAEQTKRDLEMRGVNLPDMPVKPEIFEENARRRVKLGLILAQLVVANNLQATPDKVRERVQEHAASYEKPEEVVQWYYSSPDHLAEVESLVLEDNVVGWVLGQVKVTDKPTSLDELMGAGND